MTRLLAALAVVLLAPAAAGASGTRPPVALTATPARLTLDGSSRATITVANPGRTPVAVDVARAGFALDVRGRPRIVARDGERDAGAWLSLSPRRLALPPGGTARLEVHAHVPRDAEPGDHDALVLLTTRPAARAAGVAVRMRIGVLVVVRAPGAIVHLLEPRSLAVRHERSGGLTLELLVVNRGNVTESLGRRGFELALVRGGRVRTRLPPRPRELAPHSRGIVQFAYRGPLRGPLRARAAGRTFRIRL